MNLQLPQINVTSSAAQSALREGPLSLAVSGGAHLAAVVVALVFSVSPLVGVNPPNGANVVSLSAAWLSAGEAAFDSAAAVEVTIESLPTEVNRTVVSQEAPQPVELLDTEGEVVTAGSSVPAIVNTPALTAPQPDNPARDTPQLPKQSTASPPAVSAAATGLQIDVQPGKTFAPAPLYPPAAITAKLEGVVKLRVKISVDGVVTEARVDETSGHESLDASALQAVREWRFTPARVRGVPLATEVRVPIRFQLQRDN